MRNKNNRQAQRGDPFEQIARAADAAADEVLKEDRVLRKHLRAR